MSHSCLKVWRNRNYGSEKKSKSISSWSDSVKDSAIAQESKHGDWDAFTLWDAIITLVTFSRQIIFVVSNFFPFSFWDYWCKYLVFCRFGSSDFVYSLPAFQNISHLIFFSFLSLISLATFCGGCSMLVLSMSSYSFYLKAKVFLSPLPFLSSLDN